MAEFPITAHDVTYAIEADPTGLIGGRIAETNQPYEAPLLEHIYERGFTGVAVDAGAHIGNHTLWLAAVCDLEVWAFEPLVWQELRANIERNDLTGRVHVHGVALGDRPANARVVGKGKLAVGDGPIPVVPLDSYHLDAVAVMKIDVEDMEPFVLRGAAETIGRCRPGIFAEARDDACHDAIAEVLDPWGYRMTERFGIKWTPVECWEPA